MNNNALINEFNKIQKQYKNTYNTKRKKELEAELRNLYNLIISCKF